MLLVSSCSCLCAIHWDQVLSREWRCSWSSANRRCSNYIWVIENFVAYQGASYIRDFMASNMVSQIAGNPSVCWAACSGWQHKCWTLLMLCEKNNWLVTRGFFSQRANEVESVSMSWYRHVIEKATTHGFTYYSSRYSTIRFMLYYNKCCHHLYQSWPRSLMLQQETMNSKMFSNLF